MFHVVVHTGPHRLVILGSLQTNSPDRSLGLKKKHSPEVATKASLAFQRVSEDFQQVGSTLSSVNKVSRVAPITHQFIVG